MKDTTIRRALQRDLDAVAAIYERIHDEEEAGRIVIGWNRAVYPTRETAEQAIRCGDLYVMEVQGAVVASARINREQVPAYRNAAWIYKAEDDEVLVLHTLTVDPAIRGRGCGTAFVAYYEQMARALGCRALRMDTNARNLSARRLYARLGYREADIVDCVFNGLEGVKLVCLEKRV